MYPCFETIRFHQGEHFLVEYHDERMNRTRLNLFRSKNDLNLNALLLNPPKSLDIFRCKVVYTDKIISIEYFPYVLRKHSLIELIEANEFSYNYKLLDRSFFDRNVGKSPADDVLFVKNGFLTDCSYSNIVLWNGKKWLTPDSCLLPGVKRRFLLEKGIIHTARIHWTEIGNFTKMAFINAMRDFEYVYQLGTKSNFLHLKLIE